MKAVVFGKPRPSMAVKVMTREGKVYNLGRQKDGRISKHTSKFLMNLRISYYKWHRGRKLQGQEKQEFIEQIKQYKESL